MAYIETRNGDGRVLWGVGIDPSTITAALRAVLQAHERRVGYGEDWLPVVERWVRAAAGRVDDAAAPRHASAGSGQRAQPRAPVLDLRGVGHEVAALSRERIECRAPVAGDSQLRA